MKKGESCVDPFRRTEKQLPAEKRLPAAPVAVISYQSLGLMLSASSPPNNRNLIIIEAVGVLQLLRLFPFGKMLLAGRGPDAKSFGQNDSA